jgi:hypothetical protein
LTYHIYCHSTVQPLTVKLVVDQARCSKSIGEVLCWIKFDELIYSCNCWTDGKQNHMPVPKQNHMPVPRLLEETDNNSWWTWLSNTIRGLHVYAFNYRIYYFIYLLTVSTILCLCSPTILLIFIRKTYVVIWVNILKKVIANNGFGYYLSLKE